MVRAKFKCVQKTENELVFEAVTSGSEENANFFKYTPYGCLKMNVLNESAMAQFEEGKEYYLDFSSAN